MQVPCATVHKTFRFTVQPVTKLSQVSQHETPNLPFSSVWVYPVRINFSANLARSTAAEINFRVDTIYGLLTEGMSRGQIVQFCANQWNLQNRQADEYIQRARIRLEEDAAMTRPAWIAEALGRLRTYEQSAYKRGQTQVALNAVQLQAKLIGLDT
jgi:uncharacterized protein YoaH (UPF0181 family)